MKRLSLLLRGAALAAALVAGADGPAAAASVETFVLSVGGQAQLIPPFGCSTGGAPAPVQQFFGAIAPGVPSEGLAVCQVAGSFRHQVAAAGPLSDATALSVGFNGGQPVPNTFAGSGAATAQSGRLRADADASFTGPSNSFIYDGSNGFGKFTETFTLRSPSHADGTAGLLVFGIGLVGALGVNGTAPFSSWADVELRYQQDNGPIINVLRAQTDGTTPFIATLAEVSSTIGGVVSGFTLAPRSVSGAGEVPTLAMPFVFGAPFDFTLGLMAAVVPGSDSSGQSSFEAWVARLSPTVAGVTVGDFSVVTASGTPYGAGGVLPVPELSSAVLMACGAIALLLLRRRRTT